MYPSKTNEMWLASLKKLAKPSYSSTFSTDIKFKERLNITSPKDLLARWDDYNRNLVSDIIVIEEILIICLHV
jgi:hypothetical protein